MATGTSSPPPLPASTPATRLVDERLARVGGTVKASDIGDGLMRLLVGLLGLILLWILIDHWIVGLSIWGRCLGLISLMTWTGWCLAKWVLPSLFRRINPAYAAKVAEQSDPGFRNRLLNFVLLRRDREKLRESVYRELEQQATEQAKQIDAELAVDRTGLIRISMIAATLFVLFGLYTALSPKSPLSTLARLLAPWRSIDRPARARVYDVRPGATTVYSGRRLEVSAAIERVLHEQPVWLIYSSVDQQELDQKIAMKVDEATGRFVGTLPKELARRDGLAYQSGTGIRAHLDYRIEAADAVAGPFRVTVSPAPSIVVDRVEYDFPEYTQLPDETVEGLGDIKALEGTRVRIFATANQPISSAYLEFDPDVETRGQRSIRMQFDGTTASVAFRLRLEEDRRTQTHESYRLRFVNEHDEINDQPILHQIDIDPDLVPVVEILQPEKRQTDLPLNGAQVLEIRGVDPDFGLSGLTLHGVARGRQLFTPRSLLNETKTGQVIRRLTFRPIKFGLEEGDEVEIWASGFDNRFDVFNETMAPNLAKDSDRYTLRIVAPAKNSQQEQQSGDGESGEGEGKRNESSDGEDEGGTPAKGNEGSQSQAGDRSGDDSEGEQDKSSESGDPASDGEQDGGEQDKQQDEGAQGEGQESEPSQEGGSEGGGSGMSQQAESGAGEGEQNQSGTSQPASSATGSDEGANDQQEQGQGGRGSESGGADSETTSSNSRSTERDDQSASKGHPGKGAESGNGVAGDDDQEPVPSDGSSDGDAFERVLDRMRERNGENDDGTPKSDSEPRNDASNGQTSDGQPAGDAEPSQDLQDTSESSNGESGERQPNESGSGTDEPVAPGSRSPQENEAGDQPGQNSNGNSKSDSGRMPEDGAEPSPDESAEGKQGGPQGEDPQGERPQSAESGEQGEGDAGTSQEGSGSAGSPQGSRSQSGESNGESGGQDEGGEQGSGDTADGGKPSGSAGEGSPGGKSNAASPSDSEPPDENGAQPGGESGGADSGNGEPGEGESSGGQASAEGQPGDPGSSSEIDGLPSDGQPLGAGQQRTGDTDAVEPGSDEVNLEYAKKATDLALEYLKDQQSNPDPELLERLGWTEDELSQFLNRWEALQKEAKRPQRGEPNLELDDALRSLGLHPGNDRLRRGGLEDDKLQGVRDAGVRSTPPAEYQGPYKEFMRRRRKRNR